MKQTVDAAASAAMLDMVGHPSITIHRDDSSRDPVLKRAHVRDSYVKKSWLEIADSQHPTTPGGQVEVD